MDIFEKQEHRPYPIKPGPWIAWQEWDNLLFAHWPVRYETLREKIPSALELETWEGEAWIGIVPFRMSICPRGFQATPFKLAFNEINVRTYVQYQGQPGVYFLSLDANEPFSVRGARLTYKLPYFDADISCTTEKESILYQSNRTDRHCRPADFTAAYSPVSEPFHAEKGSFEYWLTERYCLYTTDKKEHVFRAEIHHPPWPLQEAEAQITRNTMTLPWQIDLPDIQPHLLYAHHQEIATWPLRKVSQG